MKTPYIRLNEKVVVIINGKGGAGKVLSAILLQIFLNQKPFQPLPLLKKLHENLAGMERKIKNPGNFCPI